MEHKINLLALRGAVVAGHSGGVPPGLIPNPEVKPAVATVLVRSERLREAVVPVPITKYLKTPANPVKTG